jgi:hypothetical protein
LQTRFSVIELNKLPSGTDEQDKDIKIQIMIQEDFGNLVDLSVGPALIKTFILLLCYLLVELFYRQKDEVGSHC